MRLSERALLLRCGSCGCPQFLREEKREFVLSKQILRSGTSIGANVREAVYAASRKDFINKLHIALKEANETAYWIELLGATEYLTQDMSTSIHQDCIELRKTAHSDSKKVQKNASILTQWNKKKKNLRFTATAIKRQQVQGLESILNS